MGAALRKDAPNMCGRTKNKVVPRFSLIFAFPRHPWSASNPSHQHANLTRQPRSVTNLFTSTPPPGNRQQRQGDQFGGTEFFGGDKANVAGNWGSLSTGQRKVTNPLQTGQRAPRPTNRASNQQDSLPALNPGSLATKRGNMAVDERGR